jgi:hypothetical protein
MRTDLRKAAKDALTAAKDNPATAVSKLVKKSSVDSNLQTALTRLGAQQVIRDFFAAQRVAAFSFAVGRVAASLDNPDVAERVAARIARQAFWDAYTLFGMSPLRTATKQQLLDSANARETQANSELRLARFERAIASKLASAHDVVESKLTLTVVERLATKYRAAK